ncbi:FG-GAP repeat [Carpediemonas membranifera]|uniref:FG-GAP repeat n=1 Tax=Carpediemonas membranifera TaxID=201153 RepID=A0A8J6E8P6_9EUKA|nr:FG-GAP repeat [Carpediemonas membranifera]|eukprot:KAG9392215.1 FG-GAP repeat [Carpediemonas membranifera]
MPITSRLATLAVVLLCISAALAYQVLRPFETLGIIDQITSVAVSSDNLFVGFTEANAVLVYAFSDNYEWYHIETITGSGSFGASVAYADGILLIGNPSLGTYGGFHVYAVASNTVTFITDVTDLTMNNRCGDTIAVSSADDTLYALVGCDVLDPDASSALIVLTSDPSDPSEWSYAATANVDGVSQLGKKIAFGSGESPVAVVSGVMMTLTVAFTLDMTSLDTDAGTVELYSINGLNEQAAVVMNMTKLFTVDGVTPQYGSYVPEVANSVDNPFGPGTEAQHSLATAGPWVALTATLPDPANTYYDTAVLLYYYDSDAGHLSYEYEHALAPDVAEDGLTLGVTGLWMTDDRIILMDSTGKRLFAYTLSSCPAGFEADSDQCVPCRAGYYSASTDMHHCLRCPPGTYQPDTGQTECLTATSGFTLGAATVISNCPDHYSSYARLYPADYSTAVSQTLPGSDMIGSTSAESPCVLAAGGFFVLGNYVDDSSLGSVIYFNYATFTSSSTYSILHQTTTGDGFGKSLAATDDYLVIGAHKTDGSSTEQGAVYVYEIGAESIDYYAMIENPAANDQSHFGICVAVSNATVAIGAELDASIYFYELVDGTFTLDNGLTKTGVTIDEFSSMVMNDDFLVYNDGSSLSSSTVTVYSASYSFALSHQYPRSLRPALYGSILVMGSNEADDPVSGATETGEVHVYDLFDGPTTALIAQTLRLEGTRSNTHLGFSVTIDSNRIIAGTPTLSNGAGIFGGYTTWTDDTEGAWTLESQRMATGPALFLGHGMAVLDSFIASYAFDAEDSTKIVLDVTRLGVPPDVCIAADPAQRCPAGSSWDIDSVACIACAEGTFSSSYGGMCHAPAPGFVAQASSGAMSQEPCPFGPYQIPDETRTSCHDNVAGTMSFWDSTTRSCNRSGEYQDEAGQTVCKVNDLGYEPSDTRTSQVMCGSGYYQNETRQDSCKLAGAGHYVSDDGDHIDEQACDGEGEYQDETGQNVCKKASKGYGVAIDRLSVVECSSGKYQDTAGRDICKDCGMDQYSAATGPQTSCDACPTGLSQFVSGTACVLVRSSIAVGLNESSNAVPPLFEVYPADTPYTLAKGSTWDSTGCVIETVDSVQVIRCSQETSAATLAYSLTIAGTKADYSSSVTVVTLGESESFESAYTIASASTTSVTPAFVNSDPSGGAITLSLEDTTPAWVAVSEDGGALVLTPSDSTGSGTHTVAVTAKNTLGAVVTKAITLSFLALDVSTLVPRPTDEPTSVISINGTESNEVMAVSCSMSTYFSKVDSNRAFVVPVANADGTLPAGSYTMTVTMSDGSSTDVALAIDSLAIDPSPPGTVTISESTIDIATDTQIGFCSLEIDSGAFGNILTADVSVDAARGTVSCVAADSVVSASLSTLPFHVVLDPTGSTDAAETLPTVVGIEVPDSATGVKTHFESVGSQYTMTVGNYTGTASTNEGRLVLNIEGQHIPVESSGIVDVKLAYGGAEVYASYFTIDMLSADSGISALSSTAIARMTALGFVVFIAVAAIVAFTLGAVLVSFNAVKVGLVKTLEKKNESPVV